MNTDISTYSFDFSITNHCQSRCVACPRTDKTTRKAYSWLSLQHVDFEKFKARINNLKILDNANINIQLCGEWGDPMMHPEIDKFIDFLQSCNHISLIVVNTNGGLRQPTWYAKAGREYSKLYIIFGLDGIDHKTNWMYREGVDFNRAWDNMISFRRHTGKAEWQFIIFDWNYHQIEQAKQIAKEHNVNLSFQINRGPNGYLKEEMHEPVIKQIQGYT